MDTPQRHDETNNEMDLLPVTQAEGQEESSSSRVSGPREPVPSPLPLSPWETTAAPSPAPPQNAPAPAHNPYAPHEPSPASSIHAGDGAGATIQQVTVQMPTGTGSRTNSLAVLSIVAALLWVGWIGSFIAVVAGFIARRQIRENGNVERGDGLALAGMILGGVSFLPLIFFVGLAILGTIGAAAGGV